MMTPREQAVFERWVIENVDDTIVPTDEGNGRALAYNIIQRLRHGRGREVRLYNYEPDQDAEIASWYGED
jgi:hypothetical protein